MDEATRAQHERARRVHMEQQMPVGTEKATKMDLAMYYAKQLKQTLEEMQRQRLLREVSIAITKVQETQMWLEEAGRVAKVPE